MLIYDCAFNINNQISYKKCKKKIEIVQMDLFLDKRKMPKFD